MRLYIIRHAHPDYANDCLTPAGLAEADALAARLVDDRVDLLYSSPMGRAQQTALRVGKVIGKPVETLEWTAELSHWRVVEDGLGETCVWDVHGQTIRRMKPLPTHEDWCHRTPFDDPAIYVGYEAIKRNSDAFFAERGYVRMDGVYRIEKASRERIAVVCHAGLGMTWLAHLLEIPAPMIWAGFFLPTSSVTTVLFDERTPEYAVPRCLGVGDVAHIYRAGLPQSRMGIRANFD